MSDERTVIPDYVLSPNMEMPVETINGIDFIGVLRIPALELELTVINLWEGDIATFTDIDGNVFIYKMVERETLNPTDIEGMESGNWDLTLFTCTVGGQSRVTIRFELEED